MTREKKSRVRRIYRALLRAFPFDFRGDYGPEMEDVFLEQRRDAEKQGGKMALVRLWWETFVGIVRTAPGEHWETLRQDGSYAIKMMAKRPGFAGVAVVTLALGIGANVAIFSLVNGVLLEPLPFPAPDRLVQIFEENRTEGVGRASVTLPNFLDWRSQNSVFDDMALFDRRSVTFADAEPQRLSAIMASSSFLRTLGWVPIEGRDFREDRLDALRQRFARELLYQASQALAAERLARPGARLGEAVRAEVERAAVQPDALGWKLGSRQDAERRRLGLEVAQAAVSRVQ